MSIFSVSAIFLLLDSVSERTSKLSLTRIFICTPLSSFTTVMGFSSRQVHQVSGISITCIVQDGKPRLFWSIALYSTATSLTNSFLNVLNQELAMLCVKCLAKLLVSSLERLSCWFEKAADAKGFNQLPETICPTLTTDQNPFT